ncbi:hypothetical protein O181_044211 [Austropuccinia psidii MF-1]|uniref:Uncharacterized protein n=1 Tax=Austropuccinia psidii MF-1 TaxID=1389203 RepID=A0A9Q3DI24_9BASI|nr:hypothetical protein [Austropuccinia psidii MF-1]
MKESGHVYLYISDFRSLISIFRNWEDRAYIHVYRGGLAPRRLDQLDSHPGNFHTDQELVDIALELDKRYHERQKERDIHQEKDPPATGSSSFKPPQDSSSKKTHHKGSKKQRNLQVSKDKPHSASFEKNNETIGSEKKRRIAEALCTY